MLQEVSHRNRPRYAHFLFEVPTPAEGVSDLHLLAHHSRTESDPPPPPPDIEGDFIPPPPSDDALVVEDGTPAEEAPQRHQVTCHAFRPLDLVRDGVCSIPL